MSLNELIQDLGSIVSSHQLITGAAVGERATSYWDAAPTQAIAIVKPRSTQELAISDGALPRRRAACGNSGWADRLCGRRGCRQQ
jgi:hypothetical protein